MARPKKHKIETSKIEQLASYGCTNREISAFFDCSQTTLTRNYGDFLTKGREKGKIRLRQMQWKSAENGNVTMQIWLGKQVLGQSEQPMVMEDELVEGFDLEVI